MEILLKNNENLLAPVSDWQYAQYHYGSPRGARGLGLWGTRGQIGGAVAMGDDGVELHDLM
jgi:hypothetical protein